MGPYPSLDIDVADEAGLRSVAARLAAMPLGGVTIGLTGPLGAGKTTLVRWLMDALSPGESVSSPTFTLLHDYRLPGGGRLEHWDLYRISSVPEELWEPQEPGVCRVIEWADKFDELGEQLDLRIAIRFKNMDSPDEARLICMTWRRECALASCFAEHMKER